MAELEKAQVSRLDGVVGLLHGSGTIIEAVVNTVGRQIQGLR